MGMLFKTHSTKYLIAHLNDEFSTYISTYYRLHANQFDPNARSYQSLYYLTMTLTASHSPRPDHHCLMPYVYTPPGGTNPHPKLEARWIWFLNPANSARGALTSANDNIIAQQIYSALMNPQYDSIAFDAVETDGPQAVMTSDSYDGGTLFKQIVLQTPIPNYAAVGI